MTRIRARKSAMAGNGKSRRKKAGKRSVVRQSVHSKVRNDSTLSGKKANVPADDLIAKRVPKTSKNVKREKGWILSGDQPPITGTQRFVVPLKGTASRKDAERERRFLAQASLYKKQFKEVKASRFEVAFGFRPRNAISGTSGKKKKKKALTVEDISSGKVGFTRSTALQQFREQELKVTREARVKAQRKFMTGAEDRVFFLHHQ